MVLEDDQQQIRMAKIQKHPKLSRMFWTFFVVLCVAISTGCSSQLKYSLLNTHPVHFYAPFTLMWFNNCCLIICFPLYLLYELATKSPRMSLRNVIADSAKVGTNKNGFKSGPFLAQELIFLLLYTISNYAYSLSLGRITSSAALVIRSFGVSLVYLLGRLVLHEQFYLIKTVAVLLAMSGVLLITFDHEFAANLIGVLLVLISSCADSIYKVAFKWTAGNASLGQTMFFLSGMGLANLFTNALPAGLLVLFGAERWEWAFVPWSTLVEFVLLAFVFNIASIFGIALLGPLVISIGVLCGIPISIAIDIVYRGRTLTAGFLIGANFLITSVLLVYFHEQIRDLWCKSETDEEAMEDEQEKEKVEIREKIEHK